MTILAFDYGDARIGVAIKDPGLAGPQPLLTLQNDQTLATTIQDLMSKHQPDKLVVGRPRNLDGESTDQTKKAEAFADTLKHTYNKEVILQDEALTSEEAKTRIPPRIPQNKHRSVIDQYAALIILEDYLAQVQ